MLARQLRPLNELARNGQAIQEARIGDEGRRRVNFGSEAV
jgi:hypothetical protein